MSTPPRWVDLPPELTAIISSRLHDAADFVRLHAVCTRWRDSQNHTTALRPTFFPWLIAPPSGYGSSVVKLRCVFSKTSYLAAAPATFSSRRWVARADSSAAWLFAAGSRPTLLDPLTGGVTALPPFPDDDEKTARRMKVSRGIIHGDGTVFLYNFSYDDYDDPDEELRMRLQIQTRKSTYFSTRPSFIPEIVRGSLPRESWMRAPSGRRPRGSTKSQGRLQEFKGPGRK
ncbi:28 kDa ribonucleoprotein, chloroplastic [Hordeum vulgare]|nr:28 kDa ribonucleoprotein, chloroplastic [Hordeum vulgare]